MKIDSFGNCIRALLIIINIIIINIYLVEIDLQNAVKTFDETRIRNLE